MTKVTLLVGLKPPDTVAVSWIVPPTVAFVAVVASVGVSFETVEVSLAALHGPVPPLLLASPPYVARQRYVPADGGVNGSDVAEPATSVFVLTVVPLPV